MTNLGTGLGERHVAVILVLLTDRSEKEGNAGELLTAEGEFARRSVSRLAVGRPC